MCSNSKVTVCYLKPEDCQQIIIKVNWHVTHFNIAIIKGEKGFIGTMTEAMVIKISEQLGITVDDYIATCKSALDVQEGCNKFIYKLTDSAFQWKKVDGNMKIIFGSVRLTVTPCLIKLLDIVNVILIQNSEMQKSISQLQKDKQVLQSNNKELLETVDECIKVKTNLENELFYKFLSVLNSKKVRIKELETLFLQNYEGDSNCNENEGTSDECNTTEDEAEEQESKLSIRTSPRKQTRSRSNVPNVDSEELSVPNLKTTKSAQLNEISKDAQNARVDEESKDTVSQVEEMKGRLPGSIIYHDGLGFFYARIRANATQVWLRCCNTDCPVRAVLDKSDPRPQIRITLGSHNHAADSFREQVLKLRRTLLDRSRHEKLSLKSIYDEEIRGVPARVVTQLPFKHVKAGMQRARRMITHDVEQIMQDLHSESEGEPSHNELEHADNVESCSEENETEKSETKKSTECSRVLKENEENNTFQSIFQKAIEEDEDRDETPSRKRNNSSNDQISSPKSRKMEITSMKSNESPTIRTRKRNYKTKTSKYNSDGTLPENVDIAEEIEGQRTGTTIYHDGHGFFYKRIRSNERKTWCLCCNCYCPARAILEKLPDGKQCIRLSNGAHNHEADVTRVAVKNVRKKLLDRSKEETTPFRDIFDEEMEGLPEHVLVQLHYHQVKQCMQRARRMMTMQYVEEVEITVDEFNEDPADFLQIL